LIRNILKYFLGGVFLFSAFAKLIDYRSTAELFVSLFGMDYTIIKIFLAFLILLELIVAYLIIADYLQIKIVYFLIIGLITAFLFINIFFAITGADNCGCFGAEIVSSPALSIAKNVLLILAVIYLKYSFAALRLCEGKEVCK